MGELGGGGDFPRRGWARTLFCLMSSSAASSDLTRDLQFVAELARSAGDLVLSHYGKVQRQTKTHTTTTAEAVTDADRASQRLIVAGLRKRFPSDGIIGEENETGDAITFECHNPLGRNWVIDPIDGTNNFINGLGNFAVCIGLMDQGMPVLGIVHDVTRDLMYSACKGYGAWAGPRQLQALETPLSDSAIIMLTSNLLDPKGNFPGWGDRWLHQTDWKLRMLGSAALEAVSVAAGVAHASVTVNGKLWDCVAPAAIVLEAGGSMTDLEGRPRFPFDLRNYAGAKVPFLASGPGAKETLLGDLRTLR